MSSYPALGTIGQEYILEEQYKTLFGYPNGQVNFALSSEVPGTSRPFILQNQIYSQEIPITAPSDFGSTGTTGIGDINVYYQKPTSCPYLTKYYEVPLSNKLLSTSNDGGALTWWFKAASETTDTKKQLEYNILSRGVPNNLDPEGNYVPILYIKGNPYKFGNFGYPWTYNVNSGIVLFTGSSKYPGTGTPSNNTPIPTDTITFTFWRYDGAIGITGSTGSGDSYWEATGTTGIQYGALSVASDSTNSGSIYTQNIQAKDNTSNVNLYTNLTGLTIGNTSTTTTFKGDVDIGSPLTSSGWLNNRFRMRIFSLNSPYTGSTQLYMISNNEFIIGPDAIGDKVSVYIKEPSGGAQIQRLEISHATTKITNKLEVGKTGGSAAIFNTGIILNDLAPPFLNYCQIYPSGDSMTYQYNGINQSTFHNFTASNNASLNRLTFKIGYDAVEVIDGVNLNARIIKSTTPDSTGHSLFDNMTSGGALTIGNVASSNTINGVTTFTNKVNFNGSPCLEATGVNGYFQINCNLGSGSLNPASQNGTIGIIGLKDQTNDKVLFTLYGSTHVSVKLSFTEVSMGFGGSSQIANTSVTCDGTNVIIKPNIKFSIDNTIQNSAFTGAGSKNGTYNLSNITIDTNGKITDLTDGLTTQNTFTNTNTFNAQTTFNNSAPVSNTAPTLSTHLTTKSYVDSKTYQVLNFSPTEVTNIKKSIIYRNAATITASSITAYLDNTPATNTQIYTFGKKIYNWWVAVGSNGQDVNSLDGFYWNNNTNTKRLSACLSVANDVKWNGTRWVAVGLTGNNGKIAYSDNGTEWTGSTSIFTGITLESVAWGDNKWVAVGGATSRPIFSSTNNGETWTATTTNPFSDNNNNSHGYGIAYNGTRWVAVGTGNVVSVAYSNNGTSWNQIPNNNNPFYTSNNPFGTGYGVAWNGQMWVAVGTGGNQTAYSYNGVKWTQTGSGFGSSNVGYCVAWNGKMWVAGGKSDSNNILYSYDGVKWTSANSSTYNGNGTYVKGISWNGSMWIAAGYTNNSNYPSNIGYSQDGLNWISVSDKDTTDTPFNSVAFNSARDNKITFTSTNNDVGVITPSNLNISLNSGDQLDVVCDSYYNIGFTNCSISIDN